MTGRLWSLSALLSRFACCYPLLIPGVSVIHGATTSSIHISMSEQYDLLKSILLEKSVRTGTFTLASGKVSDLYVDCRMTALDPVGATLVGALGWKLVHTAQHKHLPVHPQEQRLPL